MIGLNRFKTWILIAALGGLFVLIGAWIGGSNGAIIALAIVVWLCIGIFRSGRW